MYQGISKRAVELCVTVKVILEGDAESFTPALTLEDLNSLTSSAVKRMFEQQPFPHNEPSCPPNRATGVAWQENDITRFMLYALKCGSPHILMSDIDEESDVMRPSADSSTSSKHKVWDAVESGSASDSGSVDDVNDSASGRSQKTLPAFKQQNGSKRKIRSSGEQLFPKSTKKKTPSNSGGVAGGVAAGIPAEAKKGTCPRKRKEKD